MFLSLTLVRSFSDLLLLGSPVDFSLTKYAFFITYPHADDPFVVVIVTTTSRKLASVEIS